ncbi:DUF3788 domain-containing protein [Lachnospiraceae bacterium MD1]|jgi:hypothetical protein|uniref:DUF3788 domain-containing protein n=1 Tax=Variimorphobacter saccharofermentans TaxID=2755051 RepID=A0A839JY95_9FIRM|nr:DUF3788 domain-containing protein [Variimorphobacter saccharofermentans]MBB2181451.1 DUF3788 domain-containing protein [Variimorphobacter saccharofermentans]
MQDVLPTNQDIKEMLGTEKYNVWECICNLIESLYEMDILRKNTSWNNWKYEHKYRRGGKTLCTLYAKDNCFCLQLVFGKAERDKFENEQHTYSEEIQSIYNNSTTYHDGKWMSFEPDISQLEDIGRLLRIKRRPNKK